ARAGRRPARCPGRGPGDEEVPRPGRSIDPVPWPTRYSRSSPGRARRDESTSRLQSPFHLADYQAGNASHEPTRRPDERSGRHGRCLADPPDNAQTGRGGVSPPESAKSSIEPRGIPSPAALGSVPMPRVPIDDLDDPRLAIYRSLKATNPTRH